MEITTLTLLDVDRFIEDWNMIKDSNLFLPLRLKKNTELNVKEIRAQRAFEDINNKKTELQNLYCLKLQDGSLATTEKLGQDGKPVLGQDGKSMMLIQFVPNGKEDYVKDLEEFLKTHRINVRLNRVSEEELMMINVPAGVNSDFSHFTKVMQQIPK